MLSRVVRSTLLYVGFMLIIPLGLQDVFQFDTAVAQSSPPNSSASGSPAGNCQFTPWAVMDSYLNHVNMAYALLLNPPPQPHKPAREYIKAVTYSMKLDSLGLAAFQTLPQDEREYRAKLARSKRERVVRFSQLIQHYLDLGQSGGVAIHDNINNKSVTDCIHALINATGLDPSAADAWYDLAYFTRIVGDLHRSLRCLQAAIAALDQKSTTTCPDFRAFLALEYAWLCRDLGLNEMSLDWAGKAHDLGADPQECKLVEGLALAALGRFTEAVQAAKNLGEIKTRRPHLYSLANKRSTPMRASDFAKRWIEGMAYLKTGDFELAHHQVKEVNPTRELPHATRFWNDVGLIFEMNGKSEASSYYGLAVVWLPYLLYYPLEGMRGEPKLFGGSDVALDYFRTHSSMYVAGSMYSYAAITALESQVTEDVKKRELLAQQAMAAMDICRRRGIRATDALAMRGKFLFAREDYAGALVDLRTAMTEMAEDQRYDAELYVLAGLSSLSVDRPQEAVVFFQRAIKLDGSQAETWNYLGVARIKAGDRSKARQAFDQSIVIEPEAASTWYNRGLLNFQDGDFEAATRDMQMAAMLDPEIGAAKELLEHADTKGVDFEVSDATALAQLIAQASQSSVGKRDARSLENGLITAKSGNPQPLRSEEFKISEQVVTELAKEYAEKPSQESRRNLARAYIRAGRADDARDLLLPFWGQSSSITDQTLLLEADRAMGDTRRARILAASLEQGPPSVEDSAFWSLVAFICLDAGLKSEGMVALDAAISLDPGNLALKRHRNLLSKQ